MSDFEKYKNELIKNGKSREIDKIASSTSAQNIRKIINGDELKRAASSGDKETLTKILNKVMSTEDGRKLAKMISDKF